MFSHPLWVMWCFSDSRHLPEPWGKSHLNILVIPRSALFCRSDPFIEPGNCASRVSLSGTAARAPTITGIKRYWLPTVFSAQSAESGAYQYFTSPCSDIFHYYVYYKTSLLWCFMRRMLWCIRGHLNVYLHYKVPEDLSLFVLYHLRLHSPFLVLYIVFSRCRLLHYKTDGVMPHCVI